MQSTSKLKVLFVAMAVTIASASLYPSPVKATTLIESTVCNPAIPEPNYPTIASPNNGSQINSNYETLTGSTFPNSITNFADNGKNVATLQANSNRYRVVITLQTGANNISVSAKNPCSGQVKSVYVNVIDKSPYSYHKMVIVVAVILSLIIVAIIARSISSLGSKKKKKIKKK
jgi:hypothetical protein